MRTFYQILIIIFFIIGSFFIVREDVLSVLSNISSSFNKNIKSPVIKLTEKDNVLPGKIDMPGALRVVDNLLSVNNNVELSKDNIILLTNKYRKDKDNLIALKENKKLNLSANKKLQDMFANQYFEHISKDGIGVGDLGEEAGYKYILIGENLAMGNFKNDQSLFDAWVASKGHRENILNENYTEIGVAVGKGKFEGKDIWMAVQHFATPQSICPEIDEVLFGVISFNQNEIRELESNLALRLEMINKGVIYEGNTRHEQINQYNNLVDYYNNLIANTKEKINNYNNQVQKFNSCILEHQ